MIPGMMKDKNYGEGGLNPWSVGDIYPLVIARVEVGASFKYWNVLNADDHMAGFASYDDAFAAAKGYLAEMRAAAFAYGGAKPVLSPFNPAAYDAAMTSDFVACMRGDFEAAAERMSLPEPGYGNRFYDNGNGSGVV
jgi:hypothetical protein